jgi:NADH-quinone oxidoreductase subunit G
LQDGEPYLAGTARRAVARLSAATAAEAGVPDGGRVRVSTDAGSIDLPAVVTDLPDRVVWLPVNSAGSAVRGALGAVAGSVVRVSGVEVTGDDPAETAGDDPAGEAGER